MCDTVHYVEKIVKDWEQQYSNYKETELRGLLRLCSRCDREQFRVQTELYFTGAVSGASKRYTAAHRKHMALHFHLNNPYKRVGVVVAINGRNVAGFSLFLVNEKTRSAMIVCVLVDESERGRGIGTELVRRTQAYVGTRLLIARFPKQDCGVELWKPWMLKLGFNRMPLCEELDLVGWFSKREYVIMMASGYKDLLWRYMLHRELDLLEGGQRPSEEETRAYMVSARRHFEAVFSRHFPNEERV
jgi:GNAT superfamily N-acetyltransferase